MTTPLIPIGAQAMAPPPYRCTDAALWAFLAPADEAKLAALCQRAFAGVSASAAPWEPMGGHVVLTFGRVPSITSLAQGYEQDGSIEEGQVGIWVPVRSGDRFAVFSPYMIVDNPMSLVAGREVFGYPKTWGWIDLPDPDGDGEPIGLDVYGGMFDGAERGRRPLLRVRRGEVAAAGETIWSELHHALRHLVELLGAHPGWAAAVDALEQAARRDVAQVFLKQVPDADGSGAALQQVVEAPIRVERFRGHPLIHRWSLTVDALDTHPLGPELGLASGELHGGFVVTSMDFVLEPGVVRWP